MQPRPPAPLRRLRLLRRDRPEIARRDDDRGVLWTPSYWASRGGGALIAMIGKTLSNSKHPVSRNLRLISLPSRRELDGAMDQGVFLAGSVTVN